MWALGPANAGGSRNAKPVEPAMAPMGGGKDLEAIIGKNPKPECLSSVSQFANSVLSFSDLTPFFSACPFLAVRVAHARAAVQCNAGPIAAKLFNQDP